VIFRDEWNWELCNESAT